MRQSRTERYLGLALTEDQVQAAVVTLEGNAKKITFAAHKNLPEGTITAAGRQIDRGLLERTLTQLVGNQLPGIAFTILSVPDSWGVIQIQTYPDGSEAELFRNAYETLSTYALFASSPPVVQLQVLERLDSGEGPQARVLVAALPASITEALASVLNAIGAADMGLTFQSLATAAGLEDELPAESTFGLLELRATSSVFDVYHTGVLQFHYGAPAGWQGTSAAIGIFAEVPEHEEPVSPEVLGEITSWLGFYHERYQEEPLDVLYCATDHPQPDVVESVLWNHLEGLTVRVLDPLVAFTVDEGLLEHISPLELCCAAGAARINLPRREIVPAVLPYTGRAKKPVKVPQLVVLPILSVAILTTLAFTGKYTLQQRTRRVKADISQVEKELKLTKSQLDALNARQNQLLSMTKTIQKQVERVAARKRYPWSYILAELSNRLPVDVKVATLSLDSGDTLVLEGVCNRYDRVPIAIKQLQQSPLFSKVTLSDMKLSDRIPGYSREFKLLIKLQLPRPISPSTAADKGA